MNEAENIKNQIASIGGTDIRVTPSDTFAYYLINFSIKGIKMQAQATAKTTDIYAVALAYSTDEKHRSNQIEKLGQLVGGAK